MGESTRTIGRNDSGDVPHRIALIGMGVTNRAVARALVARGHEAVAIDDAGGGSELAAELGLEFHDRGDATTLVTVLKDCGAFVATPGLADSHPVFEVGQELGVPGLSEFDLAAAWDGRDLLAITGTNGKTTVSMLTESMLEHSGIASAAVGNLDVPLVSAIDDPTPICFVVEASSFRLARSACFSPRVGTWLNFSPDHLDVHRDLDTYKAAKARIWSAQGPGDVAIYNEQDPVVASAAASLRESSPASLVSFSIDPEAAEPADYFERDGWLIGPQGQLVETAALWSELPHDRRNVLAAAATAAAGGATAEGIAAAARSFEGLAHRVQFVAESSGVRYFDDSKATTPHATLSALEGFERVVLIAGGRNKGVDLSSLGSAANVSAVVGIGEAAEEVLDAFGSRVRSVEAESMQSAVRAAAELAEPGEVVLLSPGCASFDWYESYGQRGDDFAGQVRSLLGEAPAPERRAR